MKRALTLFTLGLLAGTAAASLAQPPRITLTGVVRSYTGDPIGGAPVRLYALVREGKADAYGTVEFRDVPLPSGGGDDGDQGGAAVKEWFRREIDGGLLLLLSLIGAFVLVCGMFIASAQAQTTTPSPRYVYKALDFGPSSEPSIPLVLDDGTQVPQERHYQRVWSDERRLEPEAGTLTEALQQYGALGYELVGGWGEVRQGDEWIGRPWVVLEREVR